MHSAAAAASVDVRRGQTVNQRLRDCTNSRKIHAGRIERRFQWRHRWRISPVGWRQTPVDLACARSSASRLFTRDGGKKRCEGTGGERGRPLVSGKSAGRRWHRRKEQQDAMKNRERWGCGGAHAADQPRLPLLSAASTFHYLLSAVAEDTTTYCCQSVHSLRTRFNEWRESESFLARMVPHDFASLRNWYGWLMNRRDRNGGDRQIEKG